MGAGSTKLGAFLAICPCLAMFFSTWETYHTHTLYLGYFNGPTEGLLIAITLMIISGYFGPQVWDHKIVELMPLPKLVGDYTLRQLWVPIIIITFFTASLPGCVYHVVQARKRADLPVAPVFLEWTPMLVFTASIVAWLGSDDSHLLRDNHLTLFCLILSLVFGRLTTKIILHHLTRQPFPYFTIMLVPLVGGAVLANLPRLGLEPITPEFEHRYLQVYFVFALVVYGNWALRVIDAICGFLDINCLTIKSRKDEEKAR